MVKLEEKVNDMDDIVSQLDEAPTQGTRSSTVTVKQLTTLKGEVAALSK